MVDSGLAGQIAAILTIGALLVVLAVALNGAKGAK